MACMLAACGGQGDQADQAGAPKATAGQGLSGAGATFPAPLYARWAADYRGAVGTSVNYQPIGSGGGIKQITAGTIDFGGTDKPLTAEELAAGDLVQFPTVLGGVTPVLNVPGLAAGQLRLTGAQLADIFRGEIKTWRDPRLAPAAGGATLPNLPITVVHRSDASGTTFLFASYLAAKSPAWKSQVGASDALEWPVGIGGKGNDGVAAYVRQTVGSIGYVEYSFARENNLVTAQLQNHDGAFVAPTPEAFAAAAAAADWATSPAMNLLLLDEPGPGAWPITGATFVLVHKMRNPAKAAEVTKFFEWAFANGDGTAATLAYVPLPTELKGMVREVWRKEFGAAPASP
jgi:phosphate transport system substrate-binding protein